MSAAERARLGALQARLGPRADRLAADLGEWPGSRAELLAWLGYQVERCRDAGMDEPTAAGAIASAYLERVDIMTSAGPRLDHPPKVDPWED